jgi:hypothetical protein
MAGRVAYFMIAGGALAGGMLLQGDLKFDNDRADRRIDRHVDRAVDREVDRAEVRAEDRRTVTSERVARRDLSDAIADLVRAEGSLITAKLDENIPAAAIRQAEQRRDRARDVVERLSEDAKAASQSDRDALRENIRDSVRDAVRS